MEIEFQEANIDVAPLFPGGLLGETGTAMSLLPLAALTIGLENEFLPAVVVYIRAEMHLLLKELTQLPFRCKVVTGSPGIGKSVTFFLVALWRAWQEEKPVLYFRYSNPATEDASIFVMRKNVSQPSNTSTVNIKFYRRIPIFEDSNVVFSKLVTQVDGWRDMVIMVDGPEPEKVKYFPSIDSLCTSGGGLKITSEMSAASNSPDWKNPNEKWVPNKKPRMHGTTNVVMSAWKKEDMKEAIISCGKITEAEFNDDLFDEIYFVTGGRIREAALSYRAGCPNTSFADEAVNRVSRSAAKLALARADERSTSEHVDGIRSIFRRDEAYGNGDKVDILVNSQYIMRKLHDKIDAGEYLNSYHTAKKTGHHLAAGDYFEELMHCLCCSEPEQFSPTILGFIRSRGKGAEGVRELNVPNYYWVPSVPTLPTLMLPLSLRMGTCGASNTPLTRRICIKRGDLFVPIS